MNNKFLALNYGYHVKDVPGAQMLRQYSDHVVKEIKSQVGGHADISIHVSPIAAGKRWYSASVTVLSQQGSPIVVKKYGKKPLAVLRKVKRTLLRQIRKMRKKRDQQRRRPLWRNLVAS